MQLLEYQQAFGAWDRTSEAMRKSIDTWFRLYYRSGGDKETDPCQRIAYSALRSYQKAAGLSVDGSCGPATWAALLSAG